MTALIIGHKNPDSDSIVSAIACEYLYKLRGLDVKAVAQGEPAPETQFILNRFNLRAPEVVTSVAGKDIYLVDYSDIAQAPADIKEANLKGIIDHHKLGDMTSTSPVECIIWTVGCTNTILKRMFDYMGFEIPANLAGAMLCAILSDTVIFKSPTTTDTDRAVAEELAKIAQIDDIQKLGLELFTAKSAVEGATPRSLIFRDFKDFNMSGHKIGIGQLEFVDLAIVEKLIPELLAELKVIQSEEGRNSAILLLTDIMKEGSLLLMASSEETKVAGAFGKDYAGEPLWLDGVLSRKKQVVPALEKAFH